MYSKNVKNNYDEATTKKYLSEEKPIVNVSSTQFLFPDLDLKGIVIPQGIGTGLIQVIDLEHPFQIVPLLTPTFNERG